MKIGIGIDTGGTCTDAVVYDFEKSGIVAFAKTNTTKDDLSRGIGRALDKLPRELVERAEVIALSTTLATNACVENKGGRSKLVMFGADQGTVRRVGADYGLNMDEALCHIESRTKPTGAIVVEPDWDKFEKLIHERLKDCDAVGLVEMFAKKSGGVLEKRARDMIEQEISIPVVCGHELFSENNIIKRGASALLNAQLITVIAGFLAAVKKALCDRDIHAPFVIVRSDGSLMSEEFTAIRPVETLLCGPVASVMGAVELTNEKNCIIVDMGGTTTDVAFVRDGVPVRVKTGVRIGRWNTFVKGLFVDTFGLGGDSGVIIADGKVSIGEERVMPLCMAALRFPGLRAHLEREEEQVEYTINQQKEIYLGIRDISAHNKYNENEKIAAAALLDCPQSLQALSARLGDIVLKSHLERLIREGVIIRCGVTPTDIMHIRGDFVRYDAHAAALGVGIMARRLKMSRDDLCEAIYDAVKKKLYYNIVRIVIEDIYPEMREKILDEQMRTLIYLSYEQAKNNNAGSFLQCKFSTPATLVGVGAPTHIFLEDVGRFLGAKVVTSEYSKVANALGAIVGKVFATVTIEVTYDQAQNKYVVFGGGERLVFKKLDEAKAAAEQIADLKAREEAVKRGSDNNTTVTAETQESSVDTDFGRVYIGYKVTATATGALDLSSLTGCGP
ncbi:MAG: hydantoinase/oxoprolinase family protein [Synergistaceae bacterium]|jgi:N-methylhydantoinase A/oxoprolinase/acetone carboxylase beta subunit|nr:hydantoinase/oxoprolinase family protein [Synergistaceae bacterium]